MGSRSAATSAHIAAGRRRSADVPSWRSPPTAGGISGPPWRHSSGGRAASSRRLGHRWRTVRGIVGGVVELALDDGDAGTVQHVGETERDPAARSSSTAAASRSRPRSTDPLGNTTRTSRDTSAVNGSGRWRVSSATACSMRCRSAAPRRRCSQSSAALCSRMAPRRRLASDRLLRTVPTGTPSTAAIWLHGVAQVAERRGVRPRAVPLEQQSQGGAVTGSGRSHQLSRISHRSLRRERLPPGCDKRCFRRVRSSHPHPAEHYACGVRASSRGPATTQALSHVRDCRDEASVAPKGNQLLARLPRGRALESASDPL